MYEVNSIVMEYAWGETKQNAVLPTFGTLKFDMLARLFAQNELTRQRKQPTVKRGQGIIGFFDSVHRPEF
jgi:hypothetical protein